MLTFLRRVELAQLLIDEARRLDTEGRTRFHFQAPLQSLDLERRVARFGAAEGGATEACPCVLLLAALAASTSSTGPVACISSMSMRVVNAHDITTLLAHGPHGRALGVFECWVAAAANRGVMAPRWSMTCWLGQTARTAWCGASSCAATPPCRVPTPQH